MQRWHLLKHCRRVPHVVLTSFIALIGLSCGDSSNSSQKALDPSKAALSGKITYQGKPFAGFILLESEAGGRTARVVLQKGSYRFANLPLGKWKVRVLSPPHPRHRASNGEGSESKPVVIPAKYGDPSQSGLSVELHAGQNEFSVDLP